MGEWSEWSFMLPWCEAAFGCLRYAVSLPWESLESQHRSIQVHLPPPHPDDDSPWAEPESESDANYASRLCELRDALSLLAAVAHVDNAAWRKLLVAHCGLQIGRHESAFENTFAPRFQLTVLNSRADSDNVIARGLALFCGSDQHATHTNAAYADAMSRIASIARERERRKGVATVLADSTEVEVPVSVQLDSWLAPASKGEIEYARSIQQAIREIRAQWRRSEDGGGAPFRVTFVLESIGLDFPSVELSTELAHLVESLAHDGIKCSGFSFLPELSDELAEIGVEGEARKVVGKVLAGLFGGSRPSEAAMAAAAAGWGDTSTASAMTGPLAAVEGYPEQLGVDSVHWDCEPVRNWIFERMCSAIAINQTTSRLLLRLNWVGEEQEQEWAVWRWRWQWIAFACFSQRARLFSHLESLVLDGSKVTVEDVEAIAAVLGSDDPEEDLLGYQTRLPDNDDDAAAMQSMDLCIKAKAPMRLSPMHADEIPDGAGVFTVEKELAGVKLLHGGQRSGWVDVLVPGFGKCQTLRTSLIRRAIVLQSKGLEGVTSLTIKFSEDPDQDVLHGFLTLVGASLKYLTLQFANFNTQRLAAMVESCPNLLELAVSTNMIEMHFRLGGKKHEDLALSPTLDCDFRDIEKLALALCTTKQNPLLKLVYCLRVRSDQGDQRAGYYGALLRMLEENRTLEYLEIFDSRPDITYFDAFKAHHLEYLAVIKTTLPSRCKIAFLSVMQQRHRGEHAPKMRKSEGSEHLPCLRELDRSVIELIFNFAAVPMARRVYFQETGFIALG